MRELTTLELAEVSGAAGSPGGWFECIGGYTPLWAGGSICTASNGQVYLEVGAGSPGGSYQAGYASNLQGYLTGPSAQAAMGDTFVGGNAGSLAVGYNFGSGGMSISYGFDLGSASQIESAIGSFADSLWSDICSAVDQMGAPS